MHLYFNPRSPRGGATALQDVVDEMGKISIHAPHEGERQNVVDEYNNALEISIHAPHEGERRLAEVVGFEPTHDDFNPRSPRGGATLR